MTTPLLWLFWLINGFLALFYVALDHALVLLMLLPVVWLVRTSTREQKPWFAGTGGLALLANAMVPAPIPLILLLMLWVGAGVVWLDRFNPSALRWRVNGGLALYAIAALGYSAYAAYTSRLDPRTWAGLVAGGEAASLIAQGRSFLNTIAIWGLWVILPLGYFALLLQGVLVHPPLPGSPASLIHTVRARGKDG